jgi:hypothetical protein
MAAPAREDDAACSDRQGGLRHGVALQQSQHVAISFYS